MNRIILMSVSEGVISSPTSAYSLKCSRNLMTKRCISSSFLSSQYSASLKCIISTRNSFNASESIILGHQPTGIHKLSQSFTTTSSLSYATSTSQVTSEGSSSNEASPATDTSSDSQISSKTFKEMTALTPSTLEAIETQFNYKYMTLVQEKVLSILPTTSDLLVRAKTGTGKTLAFLIAAIESIIHQSNNDPNFRKIFNSGQAVSILILSPTRELALQIGREASQLLRNTRLKVHCMVGGNDKRTQLREFDRNRCDLVVATPGRLMDLLANERAFAKSTHYARVVILDEADTLLEMGFKEDITRILSQLPVTPIGSTTPRQTMMFSATLSSQIRSIARTILQPSGKYIDTVPENDVPTHLKLKQSALLVPYNLQLPVIYHVIMNHIRKHETEDGAKIIIFLPSTKLTAFLAAILQRILNSQSASFGKRGIEVLEIHSRLTQQARTRIAARFRMAKNQNSILVTSDISARGVDYPNVTLVLQVGAPQDTDQYIHRIGRTARAGKSGEAIIILSPYERTFLNRELSGMPVDRKEINNLKSLNMSDEDVAFAEKEIPKIQSSAPADMINSCYAAWLGRYVSQLKHLGQETIIRASHEFARGVLGAKNDDDLALSQRVAQNLGLTRVRGVILRDGRRRSFGNNDDGDDRHTRSFNDSNFGFRHQESSSEDGGDLFTTLDKAGQQDYRRRNDFGRSNSFDGQRRKNDYNSRGRRGNNYY